MKDAAIQKETCPRCEMYRQALTSAVQIALILVQQNGDGKISDDVADLFKSVHFTLIELNEGKFPEA
jgi:hypothetical protein